MSDGIARCRDCGTEFCGSIAPHQFRAVLRNRQRGLSWLPRRKQRMNRTKTIRERIRELEAELARLRDEVAPTGHALLHRVLILANELPNGEFEPTDVAYLVANVTVGHLNCWIRYELEPLLELTASEGSDDE